MVLTTWIPTVLVRDSELAARKYSFSTPSKTLLYHSSASPADKRIVEMVIEIFRGQDVALAEESFCHYYRRMWASELKNKSAQHFDLPLSSTYYAEYSH
jgi:hypothetical protein